MSERLVSKSTALDIALAYREIETAEALLRDVAAATHSDGGSDIRDAFGRVQHGLQLGVPSGGNGHRLFNVPFSLARSVIDTHIAQQRALVAILSDKARIELGASE